LLTDSDAEPATSAAKTRLKQTQRLVMKIKSNCEKQLRYNNYSSATCHWAAKVHMEMKTVMLITILSLCKVPLQHFSQSIIILSLLIIIITTSADDKEGQCFSATVDCFAAIQCNSAARVVCEWRRSGWLAVHLF